MPIGVSWNYEITTIALKKNLKQKHVGSTLSTITTTFCEMLGLANILTF